MRAWGEESKNGHETWEDFAEAMAAHAVEQGVDAPTEIACWNRIHTLRAALVKADPTIKCPTIPERPRKVSGMAPPTAAEIAAKLGW